MTLITSPIPSSFMVLLADIKAAEIRISPHIIHTPLVHSPTISEIIGTNVYLKLETLQKAGSFKVRGATNKILSHITTDREQGVIAVSSGNHAQGVAVAAHSASIPATIVIGMVFPLKAGGDQRVWGTGNYSW